MEGFYCGWPDGLELSPGQSLGSRCHYRQYQSPVENVFVFSEPMQLAQLMCTTMRSTNLHFTYLLTYLELSPSPSLLLLYHY